jgi:hypothetical protein
MNLKEMTRNRNKTHQIVGNVEKRKPKMSIGGKMEEYVQESFEG